MDKRLLILALGMFALGTDSFVMAGILPEISQSFDVPIGVAGQVTTVYAVTYALLAPTVAAIAAHVPRKTLLLLSLATFVVANLATAIAPTFGIALATRVLAGLGAAMFAPTATGAAATMVAPEKRGFALAVVITGLTASTALGTPIGAMIGGFGDWRLTMVFVSALAAASGLGIWALLPHLPLPPKITLAQRVAPIRDSRVALTLLTGLVYQTGHFISYTYFTVVFDGVLNHNSLLIGAMLVLWGTSGMVANLIAGRLSDTIGNRKVIFGGLIALTLTMALLPLASVNIWTSAIAVAVWGAVAWGLLAPQQHRLVAAAAHSAPVVLGLNTSGTYLGVTAAGVVGALAIPAVGAHNLGYIGAIFVIVALVLAELATLRIDAANRRHPDESAASA
ncbi:MFS transporter [Rhizobium sp. BK376]|uniref:MFS transporter n=1 Tax=Rhizobium sp. BK376 TaxID=2512149 RepID=UPI001047A082|nr:MFS transporter [Rhizobium sp. BK376]TCR93295.1 putative MFS family arabinose efflux permease [Rhizobium sp. BK376]